MNIIHLRIYRTKRTYIRFVVLNIITILIYNILLTLIVLFNKKL